MKALDWKHTPAGRKTLVYDTPRTPYQRLHPAQITRKINKIQQQLTELSAARNVATPLIRTLYVRQDGRTQYRDVSRI